MTAVQALLRSRDPLSALILLSLCKAEVHTAGINCRNGLRGSTHNSNKRRIVQQELSISTLTKIANCQSYRLFGSFQGVARHFNTCFLNRGRVIETSQYGAFKKRLSGVILSVDMI